MHGARAATHVPGEQMGPDHSGRPSQASGGYLAPGPYRRWHLGQNVVPRPPRTTLRMGVAQRGQGRPAWP